MNTIKTNLNKNLRLPISVNSRKFNGKKIICSEYEDPTSHKTVTKYLDQDTANGGTMTPFNIQCKVAGAPAIRKIIHRENEMIVLFADGDRVCLHRHENDKEDPANAVMWALGQKVFGRNVCRQIQTALKYHSVNAAQERENRKLVPAVDAD